MAACLSRGKLVDVAFVRVGCVCALLGLGPFHALAQQANDPSDQSAKTFGGYDCSDNCADHRAGFDWAAENIVTDEADCGPNLSSFAEGCKVFAQNPARGSDTDDQGNPIEVNGQ